MRPALPAVLSAIVMRLIEKEPDRRYQSADGLVHDLARLQRTLAAGDTSSWPLGEQPLERARKCRLGFIADLERDGGHRAARLAQEPGSELYAPVREILDRRLSDILQESFVQCRTRKSDFAA